jgi:hypothetical protein
MNHTIDLALEWITQETGVTFNKSWERCREPYMGGRGADKKTPVLFPVSHALKQGEPGNPKTKASALDNPSALLSSIREGSSGEGIESLSISKGSESKVPVRGNTNDSNIKSSKAETSTSTNIGIKEAKQPATNEQVIFALLNKLS